MIKKKQKNAPPKPRAVVTQADLVIVTGGDPPPSKIKETLVGD